MLPPYRVAGTAPAIPHRHSTRDAYHFVGSVRLFLVFGRRFHGSDHGPCHPNSQSRSNCMACTIAVVRGGQSVVFRVQRTNQPDKVFGCWPRSQELEQTLLLLSPGQVPRFLVMRRRVAVDVIWIARVLCKTHLMHRVRSNEGERVAHMLNASMDVSSGADFAGVGGLLGPPRVTALGGLSGRLYAQPVITIYGVCCACKTLPVVYRPTSIHRVTHRLASGVALMC